VLIDSWLEVTETNYKVPFAIWTSPYTSKTPSKAEIVAQASKDCKSLLKELDGSLKKSPFLAGEALTIADISLASELFTAFKYLVDENTRKGFKSTVEWMLRVAQVPEFRDVWGELTLCTQVQAPQLVSADKEEVKTSKPQGKQPAKPKTKKEEVKIDPEEQARKQQERKEKKEREAKAKLEAEEKKKLEEAQKASVEAVVEDKKD
jgi:elongation factor 1-gamma